MKFFWNLTKFLVALAAIGGIVFVVMKYLDQITACVRKYVNFDWLCNKACCDEEDCFEDDFCEEVAPEAEVQVEENDFEG